MKRPPKQVRLDEELELEVKKIAEVTGLPQIEIIRQMIRAGASAIKENHYQLPLPLRLAVVHAKKEEQIPEAPQKAKRPAA